MALNPIYSWQRLKGVAPGQCTICGALFTRASTRRKRCIPCELNRKRSSQLKRSEMRAFIMRRDKHTCAYCGYFAGHHPHIDHVMPSALGGLDTPDNLVCACPECNLRKSDKYLSEFLDELGYKPTHNPILLKCLDSEIKERRLAIPK